MQFLSLIVKPSLVTEQNILSVYDLFQSQCYNILLQDTQYNIIQFQI